MIAAAELLVERMRRFRPNVVMMFGGDGGNELARRPHDGSVLDDRCDLHGSCTARRFPELATSN